MNTEFRSNWSCCYGMMALFFSSRTIPQGKANILHSVFLLCCPLNCPWCWKYVIKVPRGQPLICHLGRRQSLKQSTAINKALCQASTLIFPPSDSFSARQMAGHALPVIMYCILRDQTLVSNHFMEIIVIVLGSLRFLMCQNSGIDTEDYGINSRVTVTVLG